MKTIIGISRDHSASMRGLSDMALEDYNKTIDTIVESSKGQETKINVVRCGTGINGLVEVEVRDVLVESIKKMKPGQYNADGRSTPLFDSVGELIEMMEEKKKSRSSPDLTFSKRNGPTWTAKYVVDLVERVGTGEAASHMGVHRDTVRKWVKKINEAKDEDVAYLVMVITDGFDNSSRKWTPSKLSAKISELTSTDKWTFVFRVPKGGSKKHLVGLGIPEHNILEWDLTRKGLEDSTQITTSAFNQYFKFRSSGIRSTKTFYANTTDLKKKDVRKNLLEITGEVDVNKVSGVHTVQTFSQRVLGKPLEKGTIFYQLVKREKEVQDYKIICIREKATGKIYGGTSARDLLGLPHNGTVSVSPGDHRNWDVFIQSTSWTRKLPEGSLVMYWKRGASLI